MMLTTCKNCRKVDYCRNCKNQKKCYWVKNGHCSHDALSCASFECKHYEECKKIKPADRNTESGYF